MNVMADGPLQETDLENLLRASVLRLRLERALRGMLAVFLAALALSTAALMFARWFDIATVSFSACAALPVVAALCAGLWRLLQKNPRDEFNAAALLDQNARTHEHFSTWAYLRRIPSNASDDLRQSFKSAQRNSTLRAAQNVRLSEHLPLRLPNWSRAVWLALIAFISVSLTPAAVRLPQPTANFHAGESENASLSTLAVSPNALPEHARVQVLSPAQMRKLELIATDPNLPPSAQADALKELQNAIGNIPENELTDDVRQLLDTLRKSSAATETKAIGNLTANAPDSVEKPNRPSVKPGIEYEAFQAVEKSWTAGSPRFSDVKAALRKYYAH